MKKKFVLIISIYLFLAMLDGFFTYLNTPDLTNEGNPLVTVLGYNWIALIIANIICFTFVILCSYYAFYKYNTIIVDVKNKREYISQIFYDRPDKFSWFFCKFPKNKKPSFALLGYTFVYGLIAARLVVIFEWLMITFNLNLNIYMNIRNFIPYNRFDIIVSMAVIISLMFFWPYKEYKKSKRLVMVLNQIAISRTAA